MPPFCLKDGSGNKRQKGEIKGPAADQAHKGVLPHSKSAKSGGEDSAEASCLLASCLFSQIMIEVNILLHAGRLFPLQTLVKSCLMDNLLRVCMCFIPWMELSILWDIAQAEKEADEEDGVELTEMARQEREAKIRAQQDASRRAKRGTVTDEQRRKTVSEKVAKARRKHLEEDREQL